MKITAEVDINWLDEDEGLDEVVERRLINALAKQLETKFIEVSGKTVAEAAKRLLEAKTELLINTVMEQPVVISEAFGKKEEYESIHDMVEKKMTALYQGKLNINGQCQKDPLLANIDKSVKFHVDKLLKDVERIIDQRAKSEAKKEVKEHELFKTLEKVVTIN